MVRRSASLALGALVLVGALAGCAPSADEAATPTTGTTTTSSAGDDEAAVRARFLEYVSLSNDVDYADPETFEPVYRVVTGTLLEQERSTFEAFHDQGWTTSGASGVTAFGEVVIKADRMSGELSACLDTSDVKYFDADGVQKSVVDGSSLYTISITVSRPDGEADWLIADYSIVDGGDGTCLLD